MAQYSDFRKWKNHDLSEEKIFSDKKALENYITSKITKEKSDIVNRLYEIDDIGAIDNISEDYANCIHEAEELYATACYNGCIAVCGLLAEAFCKEQAAKYGIKSDIKQQFRIDKLYKKHIITKDMQDKLHIIRKNRNDCIHQNQSSVSEHTQTKTPQLTALESVNNIKIIFSDFYNHPNNITDFIVKEAYSGKDTRLLIRNAMSKIMDYEIPTINNKIIAKTIVAKIDDIDIDGSYKEITVTDLSSPLMLHVIIDLTYAQAEDIRYKSLEVNQILLITITSKVSTMGLTETWQLQNIDEIIL